jgi:hypothetical protein
MHFGRKSPKTYDVRSPNRTRAWIRPVTTNLNERSQRRPAERQKKGRTQSGRSNYQGEAPVHAAPAVGGGNAEIRHQVDWHVRPDVRCDRRRGHGVAPGRPAARRPLAQPAAGRAGRHGARAAGRIPGRHPHGRRRAGRGGRGRPAGLGIAGNRRNAESSASSRSSSSPSSPWWLMRAPAFCWPPTSLPRARRCPGGCAAGRAVRRPGTLTCCHLRRARPTDGHGGGLPC